MQHSSCYIADLSTTVSIRVDDETSRKLAALAQRTGSRNAAVVAAIDAAYREYVLEQLRAEARALTANPEYRAEVAAANTDMGGDDAW